MQQHEWTWDEWKKNTPYRYANSLDSNENDHWSPRFWYLRIQTKKDYDNLFDHRHANNFEALFMHHIMPWA